MKKLTNAKIERETEKAILTEVEVETFKGNILKKIWLPKTQTEIKADGLYASNWILGQKIAEMGPTTAFYFIVTE